MSEKFDYLKPIAKADWQKEFKVNFDFY